MILTLKFQLFLLLLFFSPHVDSASIVKFLPGFDGPLPFELETGYIGIGEKEDVQLFYYFIKSERNPKEDPLLLWLDGGPGCSSAYGLFFEIGPLALKFEVYNGSIPSLVSSTYSWTKIANIIFLDQPIGSGFSYSRSASDETSDTNEAKRIHEFLQKWLSKHPEYYSGILTRGYLLGNPVTDYDVDKNYGIPFSHGMSLISNELYKSLKRICKGNYYSVNPSNKKCLELVEKYHKCIDRIDIHHTLRPDCDHTSPNCYYYPYTLIEYWANDSRVREALHVREGTIRDWVRCNRTLPYNHDIKSSVPYHRNNSINGYPSLIISGDHDFAVPNQAT